MIYPPELLDALERFPAEPLRTRAWRHMFGSYPPERENTSGARWNPRGVAAVYLSLTREGAIAEGDHAVAAQPRPPRVTRVVYEVELDLGQVTDLCLDDRIAQVGLDDHATGSDDHSMCQQVGGAAAWLERDGLLVPSARSSASNLVVFATNRPTDAEFTVLGKEELTA